MIFTLGLLAESFLIACLLYAGVLGVLKFARRKRDVHALEVWPLDAEHWPDIPTDGRVHFYWFANRQP